MKRVPGSGSVRSGCFQDPDPEPDPDKTFVKIRNPDPDPDENFSNFTFQTSALVLFQDNL